MSGTLATEDPVVLEFAESRLRHWLDAIDSACNRFRGDSEISQLNNSSTRSASVSPVFELALASAIRASDATEGLCDPTVLPALLALGYRDDYAQLLNQDHPAPICSFPTPGVGAITLDPMTHTVTLAPGCQLDLGASAKALAADLIADDVATKCGVVVEIGGDVAVRGQSPDGQWVIGISDRLTLTGREPRIYVQGGGIATSSCTTRVWQVGHQTVNHIIDPRSGTFAQGPNATATVAADSCATANAFATAALLWGEPAGYHIAQAGWSARLVRHDGTIEFVGGWPTEEGVAPC